MALLDGGWRSDGDLFWLVEELAEVEPLMFCQVFTDWATRARKDERRATTITTCSCCRWWWF